MPAIRATLAGVVVNADAIVQVDEGATGKDLLVALRQAGVHSSRVSIDGRLVTESLPVMDHPLVQGSRIEIATEPAIVEPPEGPIVVVVSGPEAGAWHPLRVGVSVRVGRADCEMVLPRDHLLSKQHVRFDFDGSQVQVQDLGSSNGTFVEGERIISAVSLSPDTFVHVGSSTLSILNLGAADRAVLGSPTAGSYPFPRTFRDARQPLTAEHHLPRLTGHEGHSTSTWWRSLLPLLSGVGFAVVTGRYIFLAIAALAPIVYAIDAFLQKRRGKKKRDSERAAYAERSAAVRAAYDFMVIEERRRCRREYPVGGVATLFAAARHRRVWERRPGDEDFLCVPFGLATRPSQAFLSDPSNDQPVKERRDLWGMPVLVNLAATGSVAVLGDRSRARAVVRSLLLGLAVTHAPSEVKLWVFAEEDSEEEWGAIRWLPHAGQEGATARIASTQADRSAMMSTLRQIIDARLEVRGSHGNAASLPMHLVVVDGTRLLPPADLSAMLVEGRSVGVIGIVTDPAVAPDGVMGTLTLGAAADEARFVSHLEPLITGVLTAEMPASWAEAGARRLAALQPAASSRGEASPGSERLAQMVGATSVSANELRERWASTGPRTQVPIGSAADAVFSIDIVRDGPHGLVGGMSRSGKTEFLKTLITSLAWANHPDDLSFVIVDFKGGIDYTAAADLPHVLEVSSNADLAGFERTLQLLAAEQNRRQAIFKPLHVANLDAYRSVRANRPDLPPVPRLVVLIDEFGELLASDEGRDQLRRIESMSRIGAGLGINLLLITQNFDGQLPPQIAANAGLRLCFRVQEASNSKAVIGVGIATTISAEAKGRGYVRLQGGDPIEFQSARVAGRRPELSGRDGRVAIRLQPFELLPRRFESRDALDVPAEETDMAAMITTITDAARSSGWSRPAVPWPKVLPRELGLEDVLAGTRSDEVRAGRADVPDQQRQIDYAIRWADEHVALLGSPRADVGSVLVTVALSAAAAHSPDDLHIYGIDFTGRGLSRIAGLPHCGGVASRNELLAVRIAKHLVDEVASRRSELVNAGVTTPAEYEQRTGRTFPHVLLLIAGAEKLSAVASADDRSAASALLTTLIAEGTGLGVQVIAAGLPAFGMYRPGTYFDRRLLFEMADPSDYLALGGPRDLAGSVRGPRRGVDIASQLVVQFATLSGGLVNDADVLDEVVAGLQRVWGASAVRRPPRPIVEITWPTRISTLAGAVASPPPRMRKPLLVGVDNASGEPVWIEARECGGSFFLAGSRKSGRSGVLLSIGLLARYAGWDVVGLAPSPNSPFHESSCPFAVVELHELDGWLASPGSDRTLLLIDDVPRLEGSDEAGAWSNASAFDLVIASGPSSFFDGSQRILTNLGAAPTKLCGIVLMPEGRTDVGLVGASIDTVMVGAAAQRRPGQGLLGASGEVTDISVPHYA